MSFFPLKSYINKPSDKSVEFPLTSHRELLENIYEQWADLVLSLGFDNVDDLDMNKFEEIVKMIEPEFIEEAYYDTFARGYLFGLCMAFYTESLLDKEDIDE